MPEIVILGSCRFEPYKILAVPEKLTDTPHTTEEGYLMATKKFYPAIDRADVIIVYAPDGIGEHTQRDIDYARENGKTILKLCAFESLAIESEMAQLARQHRIRNILLAVALTSSEKIHPSDKKIVRDIFDEQVKEHLQEKT